MPVWYMELKLEVGSYPIIGTEEEYNELILIRDNKKTFDRKALTKKDKKTGEIIWTGNKYLLSRIGESDDKDRLIEDIAEILKRENGN